MNKDEFTRRGFSDLLKENEIIDIEKEEVIDIPLEEIAPNPFQPRRHFDIQALNELAESIRTNGVLQPVIVKKVSNGYLLVAGERRCRSSKIAGFSTVPAIVRDYNNQYLAELALLENIQREDLTIVEEAKAYQNAIKTLNLTHLELAAKIGKSRSYVSNALGILSLPEDVLKEINNGNLTMGHARSLSKLKDVNRIKKNNINQKFHNELNQTKDYINKLVNLKSPVKITSNKIVITFKDEAEVEKFKSILETIDE